MKIPNIPIVLKFPVHKFQILFENYLYYFVHNQSNWGQSASRLISTWQVVESAIKKKRLAGPGEETDNNLFSWTVANHLLSHSFLPGVVGETRNANITTAAVRTLAHKYSARLNQWLQRIY